MPSASGLPTPRTFRQEIAFLLLTFAVFFSHHSEETSPDAQKLGTHNSSNQTCKKHHTIRMKETTHFLIGTSPLKPHYSLTAIGSKTGAAETHREAVGIWFFLPVQKLPTSQRFLLEPQAAQHHADTHHLQASFREPQHKNSSYLVCVAVILNNSKSTFRPLPQRRQRAYTPQSRHQVPLLMAEHCQHPPPAAA